MFRMMNSAHHLPPSSLMWFMIRVTLGEHNRCDEVNRPLTRFVTRVLAHEFSYHTFRNDIALLQLNERLQITDVVKPVCLPHNDGKDRFSTVFRDVGI